MKLLTTSICLIMFQFLFGQESLMDSIKVIQEHNNPDNGKSICTPSYWNAERDGGQRTFKKLCRMGPEIQLKISDKKFAQDRAVLIIDFLRDGVKRDEIYLFAVKNGDQWLMDGFNESKSMIDYFLAEKCSGHFNPTSLPNSMDLQNIGIEMLNYTKDIDGLNTYLKQITTDDSEFSSVLIQFTDENYDQVVLSGSGYSEELAMGYLYFEQIKIGKSYKSVITIYLQQIENGKYRIYNYGFGSPSSRSFFN